METKMICLTTIILIGLSPALGQEIYDESGEIQSDPALETSEEIFRLKIQTDDLKDSSQLKTIRNGEEYDVGKIFSHLQITQRPRPVINLRPNGGHLVIHKNNNDKDHGPHHLSHNDEYIPIKIPSDTEYVIKPHHDSHYNHGGYYITKPEVQDHHNHHGEYNHEYNIHENGHNNYEYNNHEHFNGYNDHKFPHDNYPNYYHSKPYNHGNKPSTHGLYGHSPRPSIDSYYYNGHHSSKPHESYHGDYKPHYSHVPHGESSFHHDHKPYYHGNHHSYGHLNHKYQEKPNIGYDFHHDNHRPYHNGYELHSNSHSSHDKPLHSYYNYYDIHKHEDNSHYHGPSNYHVNHKPYQHYDQSNHHGDKNDYHSSSHKPTHNIYKPSEPAHKPHKNHHHKPSKPTHPHGSNGDSHNHHGLSHHEGNLWKPYMSGVNNHKTDKHKDKPKRYQLQTQNEQIKSNSESLISEASFDTERLESTVRLQKDKTVNHTEEDLHSTAKPMHGSVENTTNSSMNVQVDKMSENTSPTQSGGHVMHIIVNKNKNTHEPVNSHILDTSKPNTYKNKTSPLIAQTNTEYGNNLKPHSTTSYEKPKPILVTASNRPSTSHNHASETHSNLDRPEQKPDNITPEHEPNNKNHFPNEHHGNHYEVIEPVFETQLTSSGAVSGIEENSDLHQLFSIPNNGESSDEFIENSYELISSHEGNYHEPHSSLGLGGSTGDYQINNPHHHNNGPYFHENHNLELQSGEESSDKSGEDGFYHQSNNHKCHTPGNHHYYHHNKPNSQQSHLQKPSYNSYPHRTHYHGQHKNERPNKFSSSHKPEFNDYHKESYRPYQDEQNSHSNHHNYYGKPVSNYHTHQVSKPFSIDHGSPYGVSGIFINNFKKRPNFWYNHGSSEYENSIETFRDDYQDDYREGRRYSGGDSSLRKSIEIKEGEDYRSRPHTSKNSGYEPVYKTSSRYHVENPHSSFRRYQYSDIGSSNEKSSFSIPETFFGNSRDGRPPTLEYDLKEGYQNHLIQEAEKALAYVMNPYAYRPHIVHHNGLQHTSHQGLLIDPNHHQKHSVYNYIQPHHGHHSNNHEYATLTPNYHHSVGLETTHIPSHNQSIHTAGHHNTLTHEHPEALHSHQSNIPVKYVYIPVLNNFQPNMQEYATKMSIPSSLSSNTLSSNLKLNRSNADYFKRLASSQSSSAVDNQEQVVEPSLEIFEAPIRVSSSPPVKTPQVVHESSPLLLHLLNSPKLTYLEAFPENVDLNARDSKEYLRRVELLEKEDEVKVEVEDDDKPITSNWHQTQELHEEYASKCKDVWDSILLAQESGIEKQGRPFSRSKDEVSTAVQELEKKVESQISKRKRSNILESESGQDSLESTCIEVLKNALLSQLEILDMKRREENNKDNKDKSQTMDKLEGDDLRLVESITVPESVPVNEPKKDDLPITFESEKVELNDRVEAEQQESLDSSQDYHW